jgi:UDP-2,3-diacylglucosamine pyrophosphatase LpxH
LDSADEYLGTKQIKWLKEELEKTKVRVFIFSHVNLFSKNLTDIQHLTDINERAMVTSLLHGHCDAMFSGHIHRRIINESGGVKYITIEDYQSNSVYCQVWVFKEGIRWEFKKL